MKSNSESARWRVKPSEQRYILLLGDAIMAGLALLISLYLWGAGDQWLKQFSAEFLKARVQAWFYFLPVVWILLMVELYDARRARRRRDTLIGISVAALISSALYLVVFFITDADLPRRGVAIFIVSVTLLTIVWRLTFIRVFTAPQFMRRMLIVGAGKSGMALLDILKDISPQPFNLVGLIDDDPNKIGLKLNDYPVFGGSSCLLQVIDEEAITDLILAITGEMNGTMFQAILDAQERGIEITTMPIVYEDLMGRVPIFLLETDWIIRNFVEQARTSFFYEMGKRLVDLVGSVVGILIIIPFLPFLIAIIAIDSGFPIFFLQYRLGKSGKLYRIIKFRTMSKDAEKDGVVRITTENDSRITRVGWFLRKTHLDEWPQFINVLKGDMSLVGPRAERSELVHELQQKIPFYRARLLIKPGITGWAQINFGYAATVEDTAIKLEYDLYYIKHRNLITDTVILLRTVGSVVGFRGQ